MSKLMKLALVVGTVVATAGVVLSAPAGAADLPLRGAVAPAQDAVPCGRCGRLRVNYESHREVDTTYGSGFDPRNFDQTEPYYYLGRERTYPQYWVEVDPAQ